MRARKKSEYKMGIREEAKRQLAGPTRYHVTTLEDHRQKVEQGLKELTEASVRAGDSKIKRVKSELTYLLNNYLPQYDTRIEYLIYEWRRSGDPDYDRGVRNRFLQARREHMNKSNPV